MPIRPFALPLSIGIDICQISRIKAVLDGTGKGYERSNGLLRSVEGFAAGTKGNPDRVVAFLRRFLTTREQELFWLRFRSVGGVYPDVETQDTRSAGRSACSHLAGRFAAKEAAIKAFRAQGLLIGFWDVMMLQSPLSSINTRSQGMRHLPGELFGVLLDPVGKHQAQGLPPGWEPLLGRKGSFDRSDGAFPAQDDSAANDAGGHSLYLRRLQRTFEELTKDVSGQRFQVSISHDGDYATAVCLVAQEPVPGDVGGEAAARMI